MSFVTFRSTTDQRMEINRHHVTFFLYYDSAQTTVRLVLNNSKEIVVKGTLDEVKKMLS